MKAEIQVRTILMHAWSEIEHKMAYKRDAHIPNQFKRKLSIMSARLEDADLQFEELREGMANYRDELINKANKEDGIFDKSLPLNLDNLQAFLDYYFPDRHKNIYQTRQVLDELLSRSITMEELVEDIDIVKDFLLKIERDIFKDEILGDTRKLTQTGVLRVILTLANDSCWETFKENSERDTGFFYIPQNVFETRKKWRKKMENIKEKIKKS